MPERLPEVLWKKAEYLVVEKGMTLDQAAELTGISQSAVKKRSRKGQWMERQRARMSLAEKLRFMADRMISDALGKDSPNLDGIHKMVKSIREVAGMPDMDQMEFAVGVWELVCRTIERADPAAMRALRTHTERVMQVFSETYAGA